MIGRQIRSAILVAGVVLIAALIYIDIPNAPGEEVRQEEPQEIKSATTTVATSTTPTIQLNGRTIHVTLADTPEERGMGLSGRTGLAEDEGMFFVFDTDGKYSFWMKDMLFSIDIIWIAADGTIVDIATNVSPDTYPASYAPKTSARYVLEMRAGWSQQYDVQPGDGVVMDTIIF